MGRPLDFISRFPKNPANQREMLCSKQDGECMKKWNAWVSQKTNWLQGSRNGAKKRMPRRRLVVDANILIRAVLGRRVHLLIADACDRVSFYVAEANDDEAKHYLAELAPARGISEVAGWVWFLLQGKARDQFDPKVRRYTL